MSGLAAARLFVKRALAEFILAERGLVPIQEAVTRISHAVRLKNGKSQRWGHRLNAMLFQAYLPAEFLETAAEAILERAVVK